MTDERVPYRIGKMGKENNQLNNTYLVTRSGLLIPDTFYFFEDTFRCVGGIKAFSDSASSHYDPLRHSPRLLERMINDGKEDIDEILAIVDPKNSFGIVKTDYRGKFLPDTDSFFNTPALRSLFERIAKPQYDFDKGRLTENYAELERYWKDMSQKFYDYMEKLRGEIGIESLLADPLPRGLSELDLRFTS